MTFKPSLLKLVLVKDLFHVKLSFFGTCYLIN